MYKEVTDKVTALYGGDVYSHIPTNAPSIKYDTPSGSIIFSPRELVDFNYAVLKLSNTRPETGAFPGSSTNPGVKFSDEEAKQVLTPKQLILYNIKKRAYGQPGSLSDNEKALSFAADAYNNTINGPYGKILSKINDEIGKELKGKLSGTQGVAYDVALGTQDLKSQWANKLASYANISKTQKGGIANSPNYDEGNLREIMTDPETANIKVVEGSAYQPAMYEIFVSGGKNHKNTSFRLTPDQYHQTFGNMYEASDADKFARPYQEQINKTPGAYTTADDGKPTTLNNAFLNNSDFQSINMYGISGNIEEHSGRYSIRINIHDPITDKWMTNIPYPRTDLLSKEGLATAMMNLNDAMAYQLYNSTVTPPTDKELKQIQEATKKPSYVR
jgi:hypothetical protein